MNLILSKLTFKLNNLLAIFMVCVLLSIASFFLLAKVVFYMILVWNTLKRDLKGLMLFSVIQFQLRNFKRNNITVAKVFRTLVKKHPNKVFFYYEDKKWTFRDLDEFSNKIAQIFKDNGFKKEDEVSLFMESKPEFVGMWLGLNKIGVVVALININQRNKPLLHSIKAVKTKAIIYDSHLENALLEIYPTLKSSNDIKYFRYGAGNLSEIPAYDMKDLIFKADPSPHREVDDGNFQDRILYIYTSGTTGFPKAAVIKNSRVLFLALGIQKLCNFKNDDILYTSLPLYHIAGGVIGMSLCLIHGGSMVLRGKFSAHNFWKDCIKYNCTVAQYIGEICRYLLNQPESTEDRSHRVRVMFGNGLKPTVWKAFRERFGIKVIREFYGSTEGNTNVVNMDNQIGACGFVCQLIPGRLLDLFYPVAIIKVDDETGKPIRNAKGLCIRCKPSDTGEIVGRIMKESPSLSFDGYANKEASEKKIVRDVFQKGDEFYSSGDLVYLDKNGYVYFKDRTGDTFRWKGENVSTTEVESVINSIYQEADCVVYGVEVPGCEGKIGMVTISLEIENLSLDYFLGELKKALPRYAIPHFIRVTQALSMTETFKPRKMVIQKEGYDISQTNDTIYYLDNTKNQYVKLDQVSYKKIQNGEVIF